jgi:hypothetical protein
MATSIHGPTGPTGPILTGATGATGPTVGPVLTGATGASGAEGVAGTVQPSTAVELHQHESPSTVSIDPFTGTLLAGGVAAVALRERISFHRSLDDTAPT